MSIDLLSLLEAGPLLSQVETTLILADDERRPSNSDTESEPDSDSSSSSENADSGETVTREVSKRQANQAAWTKHLQEQQEERTSEAEVGVDLPFKATTAAESDRIIDRVRDYQQELFERAKQENIIAVLDTGSGKTLIACLLIRHTLDEECLNRAAGNPPRYVFFVANSVHLVEQQGRVLKNNLIEQPAILHGDVTANLWTKTTWDKIRDDNKIVVCTPEILNQCLMHSFVKMEEISLLVFDEAHHAKKNHPYSRIIRSYYMKCDLPRRPKIFGMTASAVDTKGNIAATANNLEELLHAKIVTTDDGSLLSFAPKPKDIKWIYQKPRHRFRTELHQDLLNKVSFCNELKSGFTFSSKAVIELGPWCADRVWHYVMGSASNESSRIRSRYERSNAYAILTTLESRQQSLQAIDEATLLVQEYFATPQDPLEGNLSTKVKMLHEQISEHYRQNPNTRAIVFVEERLKALVLHDCFAKLNTPNVRTGVLLGIAGTTFEAISMKSQEQALQRFRAGLINLIFATSVADEGLDIPQCNLCIRFDLCKTTIQYMQSKGRARMRGSHFAHMIENGHVEHEGEVDFQIENEQYIKRWCASLAPDRKLGRGTQLMKLLNQDGRGRSFQTSTGALCDNSNALTILARFAASLQHTGAIDREVYEEEIDPENLRFRYVVRLPSGTQCPVRGVRGDWKPNKQQAKRSAAVDCCLLLRKKELLDLNLDSVFQKVKPENANALLAVNEKKSEYDMQIKPSLWQKDLEITPTFLYATVLRFFPERQLKRNPAPLVMLTKSLLPQFPSFFAFLEDKVRTEIQIECILTAIPVTKDELRQLTTFTLNGVFADVFNKVYALQAEKMSYWLAPMATLSTFNIRLLSDVVNMSAVRNAQGERLAWTPGTDKGLWTNKFLCDPLNGRFHYFTGDTVPGAKVTDPVPDYVPRIAQKKRRDIIDFSDSLWTASKKKSAEVKSYDKDQPVFSADLIGTRRNFLDAAAVQDLTLCLIAPEPLQLARIGPEFAASCLVWPALIHRIEAYMIVLEAFEKLDLAAVPADLALEAFTKDADNEEEGKQTHTGGKRGMGKNYERLEFIGDSLLKMTTTMTIFNRTVCDEEGMHCRRMAIICNRNMYNVSSSEDMLLFRHARALAFDRATWYPEHLTLLHGRGAKKVPEPSKHAPKTQALGQKTIADISEAIIGAAMTATKHLPAQDKKFDLGIRAITKLVKSEDHAVDSWAEIASQYKAPTWSLQQDDPIANERAKLVSAKTGYQFRNPRLLRSAFTHSSDMNSPVPDLQRLEFLGDAVLDWVCISWLFESNPSRNPQWLTEHKMAMVSNKFLAALAITLDFDKFVFVTTAKLISDISIYAMKVRNALQRPGCPRNFWTEIESPPKALSDLVEAYLGAVLVDSGFAYTELEKFFEKHIKQFFENINDYDTYANRHPTTYLYNRLSQDFKCHIYDILDTAHAIDDAETNVEILAGVLIHGRTIAEDKGSSARYVRVRVSKKALTKLEGLTREQFRQQFSCDCVIIESEESKIL